MIKVEKIKKLYEGYSNKEGTKYVLKKKLREANELSSSSYKDKIGDYFNHTFDFEFLDVVAKILERAIDNYDGDLNEAVDIAMDDGLIYYADQWEVLEFYCTPTEANWGEAYENFYSDIYSLAEEIIEENGEEIEESIKKPITEQEVLPKKGIKFLGKLKRLANSLYKKFDKDDAKVLAEVERMHNSGELTDEEHKYITTYYDTLVDAHYSDKNRVDETKHLWDTVYNEIFDKGSDYRTLYVPVEDEGGLKRVSYNKYIEPGKLGLNLNSYNIIAVCSEEGIARAKEVAKAFDLETREGNLKKPLDGERHILLVLIPKEYEDKTAKEYIKEKGLDLVTWWTRNPDKTKK